MALSNFVRKFSSALYITGDKAHKHFAALSPVIDFDQLKGKEDIRENIRARQLSINLEAVEEKCDFFKDLEGKKSVLERTRVEIGKRISDLIKHQNEPKVEEEIQKLKLHMKMVKEEIKNLRSTSYNVEEQAALDILNLPNKLDPRTPTREEKVLFAHLNPPTRTNIESHSSTFSKTLFKFSKGFCYLNSEAALFEFAVQNYFASELKKLRYVQTSNSDFVKSVIVEGCGSNPFDGADVLTLENIHCIQSDGLNRLHLVGASSLYSFMAYFAKHFVQSSQFPLKMFSVGRKYGVPDMAKEMNLFNLSQSSEIGLFIADANNVVTMEEVLEDIKSLYENLGFHFRLVLPQANALSKAESMRISVQMFSGHLQSYVEVGRVSFYQDFISKRMLFNYNDISKERCYPNVIAGSLVNVHKMLGCVLESDQIELLSDSLQNYL